MTDKFDHGGLTCLSLVAALLVGCSAESAPAPTTDSQQVVEQAVHAITDSIAAAVDRKDVPRLADFMSDAQYIGSGLLIPPGQFAALAGPGFTELASINMVWKSREVRVITPRAAILTARSEITSRDRKGKAGLEHGLYTMVFAKSSAGSWRLVSLHKTSEVAP